MKTTTQHTPGPWFVNGPWHIQAAQPTTLPVIPVIVAQVTPLRSANQAEREANANLIAAAPELLEALTALVAAISEGCNSEGKFMEGLAYDARSAISKACGGAS